MALFVMRAGYSFETTATGGRVVHMRTGDALELSAAEAQILARATAGGVDPDDLGLRPAIKKLAGLGILEPSEASSSEARPTPDAAEPPRMAPGRIAPDAAVPLLRSDLRLKRAGNAQVRMEDPASGTSATFDDCEISLARMFDGRRKVAEVLAASQRLGIPVSLGSLGQLVQRLDGHGFLAPAGVLVPERFEGTTWEPRKKWDEASRVLFQTGLRLVHRGRQSEAVRYFEALLAKDPDNAEARQWLDGIAQLEESQAKPVSAPRQSEEPQTNPVSASPQSDWLASPDMPAAVERGERATELSTANPSQGMTESAATIALALEDEAGAVESAGQTLRFGRAQLSLEPSRSQELDSLGESLAPDPRSSRDTSGVQSDWVPDAVDGALELLGPDEEPPRFPIAADPPSPGVSAIFSKNELEGLNPTDLSRSADAGVAAESLPALSASMSGTAGGEGGLAAVPRQEAAAAAAQMGPLEPDLRAEVRSLEVADPDPSAAVTLIELPAQPLAPSPALEAALAPEAPSGQEPSTETLSAEPALAEPSSVEPSSVEARTAAVAEVIAAAMEAKADAADPGAPAALAGLRPPSSRPKRRLALGLAGGAIAIAAAGIVAWRLGRPARLPAAEGMKDSAAAASSSDGEQPAAPSQPRAMEFPAPTLTPNSAGPAAGSPASEARPPEARLEGEPKIASALQSPNAAEAKAPESETRWTQARIVRRGRVTMGEIRAPIAGTVSWSAQAQQRIRAGQALGILRASKADLPGSRERQSPLALKAPKAGLFMPAVADRAACGAGDKLGSVVYHEAYLIALVTAVRPESDWECRLSDVVLDQRERCHVVTVAQAAGGWTVTATTPALWIDTAPAPTLELAPPRHAAAQ